MELLVKASGVARKSIYRHFESKEELTETVLNERDERWMKWFRTESDKGETPNDRVLNMFTVLKGWFDSEGFRGCAFINTAGEVADHHDPIRKIAKIHKEKLLDYIFELTVQMNIEHPEILAKQLLILIEGAITTSYVMADSTSADNAKEVAKILLGNNL